MIPLDPPAILEVDPQRRYIRVDDTACQLLGYSRDELLQMRIDDLSYPSGAHVSPLFETYREHGELQGLFALKAKSGEVIWIRYTSEIRNGRMVARWVAYERRQAE